MTRSAAGIVDPASALPAIHERDGFRKAVARVVGSAAAGERLALVLFDLGPSPAERVVAEAAAALRAAARESDVVGRVGEHRLALLLGGATAADASRVATRVREAVEGSDLGVRLAVGVAEWRAHASSADVALRRATKALMAAGAEATRGEDAGAPAESEYAAQLREYARALRTSYARELRREAELHETYMATVKTLAMAVEAKDDYTGGHIHRVHELGLLLACEVVPDEASDEQLAFGFLLHDVGKLSVPDAVLTKPGRLSGAEWELMRRHPREGARILAGIPFLGRALDIVLYHHERWDGQGYPHGLEGEEIPIWARLFSVVDTVDAMTSDRPYRAALPLEDAIDELRAQSGKQFDPHCVEAFERLDHDAVRCVIRRHQDRRPE